MQLKEKNMNKLIRRCKGLSPLLLLIGAWVSGVAIVVTFKLWLFGSLAVSSVKSVSGSCGKTYPVEIYVVNGDWFCAEVEDDNKN